MWKICYYLQYHTSKIIRVYRQVVFRKYFNGFINIDIEVHCSISYLNVSYIFCSYIRVSQKYLEKSSFLEYFLKCVLNYLRFRTAQSVNMSYVVSASYRTHKQGLNLNYNTFSWKLLLQMLFSDVMLYIFKLNHFFIITKWRKCLPNTHYCYNKSSCADIYENISR